MYVVWRLWMLTFLRSLQETSLGPAEYDCILDSSHVLQTLQMSPAIEYETSATTNTTGHTCENQFNGIQNLALHYLSMIFLSTCNFETLKNKIGIIT